MTDILEAGRALLGTPAKIDERRRWATWWCPFHPDEQKAGVSGKPNFGLQIDEGYWKCLRCGASGGGIPALAKKQGEDWQPAPEAYRHKSEIVQPPEVRVLDEALSVSRSAFHDSQAWTYLRDQRQVSFQTALIYGLGVGVPRPKVRRSTWQSAKKSRLVSGKGWWLWAGGIVYAEPATQPLAIQVRHLREKATMKYQTWGRLLQPMGAWRINSRTKLVIVVEGMVDMLIFNQALHEKGMHDVRAVYTAGATPAYTMLDWFSQHPQYEYLLVPDPDEAGYGWIEPVAQAIEKGQGGQYTVMFPPGDLDPDEAILSGWWPPGL